MSAPLRDESDGKLKAWPGGGVHYPGGHYEPIFRHATAGEAAVESLKQAPWIEVDR